MEKIIVSDTKDRITSRNAKKGSLRIDNLAENQVLVYYNAKEKKIATIFWLYFRIIVMARLDQNCQMALDFKLVARVARSNDA